MYSVFYSNQATHCRTMVPCQDTPSVKHTYYAQVTCMNSSKYLSAKRSKLKGKSCWLKSTVLPVTLGILYCVSGVCPQRAGGFDECIAWWSGTGSERQQPSHLSLQTAGQCLLQWRVGFQMKVRHKMCINFSLLQVPMPSYLIALVVGALESRWSFSFCSSSQLLFCHEPCFYLHVTTTFTYSVLSI